MERTVISVQFKNRNKEFVGKTYDFLLNKEEEVPNEGDIVRLMDNAYDYLFYGTRVKVVEAKFETAERNDLQEVRYITSSLDD